MLYVVVLLYHTLYFVPRRHQGINHITLPSSSLHIIASVPIFSTPNPTSSVGFIKVRFYTINYFKLRCIGISSLYGPVPTALLIPFYSKIPRSAVRTGPELKIYASPPPTSILNAFLMNISILSILLAILLHVRVLSRVTNTDMRSSTNNFLRILLIF